MAECRLRTCVQCNDDSSVHPWLILTSLYELNKANLKGTNIPEKFMITIEKKHGRKRWMNGKETRRPGHGQQERKGGTGHALGISAPQRDIVLLDLLWVFIE
jgi:hypothetical protein